MTNQVFTLYSSFAPHILLLTSAFLRECYFVFSPLGLGGFMTPRNLHV